MIPPEHLITDIFEERFTMIFNAIKEKYPEMIVVGTVGPFNEGCRSFQATACLY